MWRACKLQRQDGTVWNDSTSCKQDESSWIFLGFYWVWQIALRCSIIHLETCNICKTLEYRPRAHLMQIQAQTRSCRHNCANGKTTISNAQRWSLRRFEIFLFLPLICNMQCSLWIDAWPTMNYPLRTLYDSSCGKSQELNRRKHSSSAELPHLHHGCCESWWACYSQSSSVRGSSPVPSVSGRR